MDVVSTISKKHDTLWKYSSGKRRYSTRIKKLSSHDGCVERDELVCYGVHDAKDALLKDFSDTIAVQKQEIFYHYTVKDMW